MASYQAFYLIGYQDTYKCFYGLFSLTNNHILCTQKIQKNFCTRAEFFHYLHEQAEQINHTMSKKIEAVCIIDRQSSTENKNLDVLKKYTRTSVATSLPMYRARAMSTPYLIDAANTTKIINAGNQDIAFEEQYTYALLENNNKVHTHFITHNKLHETIRTLTSHVSLTSFPVSSESERDLIDYIKKTEGITTVSWHILLCTQGLERIFSFLASRKKVLSPCELALIKNGCHALEISKARYQSSIAFIACEMLIIFYARYVRTIALTSVSYGGIFITGNLMISILDTMLLSTFWKELRKTPNSSELIDAIPVLLITSSWAALYGAAIYLHQHPKIKEFRD